MILAEGDEKKKYLIGVCQKIFNQVTSFSSMIAIGVIMEHNMHNFLFFLFGASIFIAFSYGARKILEAREARAREAESDSD